MPKRKKSKTELKQILSELCQYIQQLEPKAQILKITPHRLYEADDGWIEVLLPYREWNRKADKIADAIYKRVWEIEMDQGYFVGVSLRTLDEMKALAQG
ncbi:MAG: hypothetical protein NZ805_11980 [Armatimonadetes bacterium]|nr:hypothetical protein [Armatimonadota bacterium]MDW8028394.1 hypothetical protein [Armatimonadota bacterium]